ncbi:tetratricopeptide repeat protein [Teichococcus oryzae]|uniref:Uncharacterized protein n=1 Tax=Teichococcus oryzae TaxID=1608942 RepID=A0A5B2TK40_9PROT|nr:hypothetical protein [Pseudoroseomonas oryzae]KAA2214375.1 hypothetical protein F0Q34_01175 [Pseudoroseomonas oryzae]
MRFPLRGLALSAAATGFLLLSGTGPLSVAAPDAAEATAAAPGTSPSAQSPRQEPPRLAEGPEYEACLGQLRSDPEGAIARASQWEESGGGDGARHCLALGLLAVGDAERAAGRLERLAASSSAAAAARAALYAQAAQAWMLSNAPNRAYAAATLALSLTPEDPALLVDRALAAASLGRYPEALLDLDQSIRADGTRADSWVFRAAALRRLDRRDEALRDVQHALSLDPRNAEALLERGILRQLKGDRAGARADWQSAIRLAPDSPAADLAAQNLALNEAGPKRR